MSPVRDPSGVEAHLAHKDASYLRNRRQAHVRKPSEGSTRDAFLPMPEPYAQRKRPSGVQTKKLDLGSMASLAIEIEAGEDSLNLAELIGGHSPVKPSNSKKEEPLQKSTTSGHHPALQKPKLGLPQESLGSDSGGHNSESEHSMSARVYGTIETVGERRRQKESALSPLHEYQAATSQDDLQYSPGGSPGLEKNGIGITDSTTDYLPGHMKLPDGLVVNFRHPTSMRSVSAEIEGPDRFFSEESREFRDSPTFEMFGQVQSGNHGIMDSLRYSDRSIEDGGTVPKLHSRPPSLFGSNLLESLSNMNFLDTRKSSRKSLVHDTNGSEGRLIMQESQSSMEIENRLQEINAFAQLVQASASQSAPTQPFGSTPVYEPASPKIQQLRQQPTEAESSKKRKKNIGRKSALWMKEKGASCFRLFRKTLDPTSWLWADVYYEADDLEESYPLFPEDRDPSSWTIRGWFRFLFYNPAYPEFTSLHLFVWSIIIGLAMGIYTAMWKFLIEGCVDFVWVDIPEFLKQVGFFTEVNGIFPMTHYMWICPTIFGCVLSYMFAALPKKIPGQNEWIQAVHAKGVQEADTFWQLFILSTFGMMSGMSLGPELPLVLTGGMAGSYLGILTKQSILQARVLNLVAASSAVGGFFGFPMAGALFVMEIPHRMGLQYFEALSPSIFGSIVAVLTNRIIVNNDVTGYYKYPFLTSTLPSTIFWHAVIFGLYGMGIGVGYAKGVLKLKGWVHDIFHSHDHSSHPSKHSKRSKSSTTNFQHLHNASENGDEEKGLYGVHPEERIPLVGNLQESKAKKTKKPTQSDICAKLHSWVHSVRSFSIKDEPRRAAVSGAIAGFLVGVIGMFVPHVMFWGEAQLQNLIDKGRTPLPIFGRNDDPNADLLTWGFCLINPDDEIAVAKGYGLGCSALITLSKIAVTGLSLGTGIIGGHFWGPLFTGCIASHFFTDFANFVAGLCGRKAALGSYPCVALLCTMGATHVVTFRAHTAIMLILTLTISAFNPEDNTRGFVAGDYSAVFPLLVVSVYVSLMISREYVTFYGTQRSRGDIMALPEVLCEPGKKGAPMFVKYDYEEDSAIASVANYGNDDGGEIMNSDEEDHFDGFASHNGTEKPDEEVTERISNSREDHRIVPSDLSAEEIERAFADANAGKSLNDSPPVTETIAQSSSEDKSNFTTDFGEGLSSSRLDQLLAQPFEKPKNPSKRDHRRVQSAAAVIVHQKVEMPPINQKGSHRRTESAMPRQVGGAVGAAALRKIETYGEVVDFQPSLMDQARARASSLHKRVPSHSRPSTRGHSRNSSMDSLGPDFY